MLSFISAVRELTLVSPSEEAPVTFGPVGDALGRRSFSLQAEQRSSSPAGRKRKHKCPRLRGAQRVWTPLTISQLGHRFRERR